jgi:hypothetical protein
MVVCEASGAGMVVSEASRQAGYLRFSSLEYGGGSSGQAEAQGEQEMLRHVTNLHLQVRNNSAAGQSEERVSWRQGLRKEGDLQVVRSVRECWSCVCVSLSSSLFLCLPVCLSTSLSRCLSVCLCVGVDLSLSRARALSHNALCAHAQLCRACSRTRMNARV